jgi:hypothetical protein
MVDTLVLVSLGMKCPQRKPLNEALRTVAEYQWMNDDTFIFSGLRCELKEGGACKECGNCSLRAEIPRMLQPIDLDALDYYFCSVDYGNLVRDYTDAIADCKQRFMIKKLLPRS